MRSKKKTENFFLRKKKKSSKKYKKIFKKDGNRPINSFAETLKDFSLHGDFFFQNPNPPFWFVFLFLNSKGFFFLFYVLTGDFEVQKWSFFNFKSFLSPVSIFEILFSKSGVLYQSFTTLKKRENFFLFFQDSKERIFLSS